jgi:hypothetical protein
MTDSFADLLLDQRTSTGRALADRSNADLLEALEQAPRIAERTLNGDPDEQLDAVLVYRSVAAIMVEALRRRVDHVFSRGAVTLAELWEIGNRDAMLFNVTPDFEATLWESIGILLYAVGALAVHWELWPQVREISQHESPSSGEGWLRQGQVVSARTADPTDSFSALVIQWVTRLASGIGEDEARQAFARFDLLSALVISELDVRYGFYPNAAEFDSDLVEPLVIDQLRFENTAIRSQVYPGRDQDLQNGLKAYDEKARAAAAYMRWARKDWQWVAFRDGRTWSFINEGHILEQFSPRPGG